MTPVTISHNPYILGDTLLAVVQQLNDPTFQNLLYLAALLGFVALIFGDALGEKAQDARPYLIGLLIVIMTLEIRSDLAIYDPLTDDTVVIEEVPAAFVVLSWSTSAIGQHLQALGARYMTSPSGTDVLGKGGVGRGLAILQGMSNVPWTERSNSFGAEEGKKTDLESTIESYIRNCYVAKVVHERKGDEAFAIYHQKGSTNDLGDIWDRVRADYIQSVPVIINSTDGKPRQAICETAHDMIRDVITQPGFGEALVEDAVDHMAQQIAAVNLPGIGVNSTTGEPIDERVRVNIRADAEDVVQELFGGSAFSNTVPIITFLDKLNQIVIRAYDSMPNRSSAAPQGRLAAAWDDAKAQTDLSMAAQGDWFQRNAAGFIKQVEIMAFGFMPFLIVGALITKKGLKALVGIGALLMWMQMWPICYVIINHLTIHTVIAKMSAITSSIDNLGMLEMYNLWEEARHSYAMSQNMLGMTPILTGMIMSGGVMWATKLAGNFSASENLDESRVYRDTENVAPRTSIGSNYNATVDDNGGMLTSETNSGLEAKYNSQQVHSSGVSAADQLVNTQQRQLSQNASSAVQNMIEHGTAQERAKVYAQDEDFRNSLQEQYMSSYLNSDQEQQANIEKAILSSGISGSADLVKYMKELKESKDKKLDAFSLKAEAKLSGSSENAFSELWSKSEGFQKQMTDSGAYSKGIKFSDAAKVADTFSDKNVKNDMEQYQDTLSDLQSAQRALQAQKSYQQSNSVDQTITEGQVAARAEELVDDLTKLAQSRGVTDADGKQELAEQYLAKNSSLPTDLNEMIADIWANDRIETRMASNPSLFSDEFSEGRAMLYEVRDATRNHGVGGLENVFVNEMMNGHAQVSTPYNPALDKNEFDPTEIGNRVDAGTEGANPQGVDQEAVNAMKQQAITATGKPLDNPAEKAWEGQGGFSKTVDDVKNALGDAKERAKETREGVVQAKAGTEVSEYGQVGNLDRWFGINDYGIKEFWGSDEKALSSVQDDAKENFLRTLDEIGNNLKAAGQTGETGTDRSAALSSLSALAGSEYQDSVSARYAQAKTIEEIDKLNSEIQMELTEMGLAFSNEQLINLSDVVEEGEVTGLSYSEALYDSFFGDEETKLLIDRLQLSSDGYAATYTGQKIVSDERAINAYGEMKESLSEDGLYDVSDYYLNLSQTMGQYAAMRGEYEKYVEFQEQLEEMVTGQVHGTGIGRAIMGNGPGSKGRLGEDDLQELMTRTLGENSYEEYLAMLPEELKEKMDQDMQEILERNSVHGDRLGSLD